MQPVQQVKIIKRSGSVGAIASLATSSSDEIAASAGDIQEFNASKLAGYQGHAMVARRDAPMVRKGNHLSMMRGGCDD